MAGQPASGADPRSGEAAVRQALTDLHGAFDRRDVASILALCSDDVVFFGSGEGEEAVGREELAAALSALEVTAGGTSFSLQWESVDIDVRGDIAFVRATGAATIMNAQGPTVRRYRLTGVLARVDGRWLWRVHHGSEAAAW